MFKPPLHQEVVPHSGNNDNNLKLLSLSNSLKKFVGQSNRTRLTAIRRRGSFLNLGFGAQGVLLEKVLLFSMNIVSKLLWTL